MHLCQRCWGWGGEKRFCTGWLQSFSWFPLSWPAQVISWWKSGQPSKPLAVMADKFWSCTTSQGQCERYWALANRDRCAIRNRLAIETQSKLQSVAINLWAVVPDMPEPVPPSMSGCLSFTKLSEAPSRGVCGVQSIIKRDVRQHVQDVFPEDDQLSLASSSSSSSDSDD